MIFPKISFKILLLTLILAVVYLPGFVKIQKLSIRKKELEREIRRLKEENKALSQEIDRLQHDPSYVEKVAREELRMGKEGEIIYKVLPEKKNELPPTP